MTCGHSKVWFRVYDYGGGGKKKLCLGCVYQRRREKVMKAYNTWIRSIPPPEGV